MYYIPSRLIIVRITLCKVVACNFFNRLDGSVRTLAQHLLLGYIGQGSREIVDQVKESDRNRMQKDSDVE